MKPRTNIVGVLCAALTVGILSLPAAAQTTTVVKTAQDDIAVSGTVVSVARNSMTVRTEGGLYLVFVYDRYTAKPTSTPIGSTVRVLSVPTGESGVRVATDVTITKPAPAAGETAAPQPVPAQPKEPAEPGPPNAERAEMKPYETAEAVPVAVRRLESDIERQARKWSAGFRTGVGLDPEVLLVGVQARVGPFFNRGFSFRPNVDFGFGEVTKLFAVDLNGVYRLPITPRQGRWSAFVGAGPCLSFLHRNFERANAGENSIDFGEFDFQAGLNILTGVEFRSGLFVEVKTTVYAGPHMRLAVGYSF